MGFTKKKKKVLYRLGLAFIIAFLAFLAIPVPGFDDPLSTVIYDRDYGLLSARVASDEQWRFPNSDTLPTRFETCIRYFEDEYFYYHPGVNPVSFVRAIWQNISAGKIVSGGSTISMQVVRLSRKGKSRTIWEKMIEIVLAFRLELSLSKKEIINLYASYAPFGGNVVGLEAASWRYFGRPSSTLSWGEAAALAVLPNAPSIIFPGTREKEYLLKRNRLLEKVYLSGEIDSTLYSLSALEELPSRPYALPNRAPHLLQRLQRTGYDQKIVHTSIDGALQDMYVELMNRYHDIFSQNEIHNGAILVIDNRSRKVLAYVGNTDCERKEGGRNVDIISSMRSTGSVLKPFLYASALDEGRISMKSLIPDIPTKIAGFAPKNFDKKYAGAVSAEKALTRSLNVPAVRLLRDYGLENFNHLVSDINLKSINKGPDHYGLSVILGGAESSLWELTGAYSSMASTLNHYFDLNNEYYENEFSEATILEDESFIFDKTTDNLPFSAASIWRTFEVLTELQRPRLEGDWKLFESRKRIAWKTGTSYGFRDAWSIGVTPEYTVGVWIGNASGEGRPYLIGLEAAAPVMFDVFNRLPSTTWFTEPYDDVEEVDICISSGDLPSEYCEKTSKEKMPYTSAERMPACVYHKMVHLNSDESYQVNSSCYEVSEIKNRSWFVLPPAMEWFYLRHSADYRRLPPLMPGCDLSESNPIQIIYPRNNTSVIIPQELDGSYGRVVLEAAHNDGEAKVFWHLDNEFLQITRHHHKIEILPDEGEHVLTLFDELGNELVINFDATK